MKKMKRIDQKSILYFIIYGGILSLIILLGILPMYLKTTNQIKENDSLTQRINEQKEIGPLYASIQKDLKEKSTLVLPNPPMTALSRAQIVKFQTDVRETARKTGLKVNSISADLNSSGASSTSVMHSIALAGELANFRKMIIGMGAIPYLERIEEVNIQQGTNVMEFKMKVWVAVK